MDTLAGLAFSYEVPRIEYMKETPKKKEENIINKFGMTPWECIDNNCEEDGGD